MVAPSSVTCSRTCSPPHTPVATRVLTCFGGCFILCLRCGRPSTANVNKKRANSATINLVLLILQRLSPKVHARTARCLQDTRTQLARATSILKQAPCRADLRQCDAPTFGAGA